MGGVGGGGVGLEGVYPTQLIQVPKVTKLCHMCVLWEGGNNSIDESEVIMLVITVLHNMQQVVIRVNICYCSKTTS